MRTYVPVVREEATNSWTARCPLCKVLLYMATDEAVALSPRRPSGSSLLIPIMPIQHRCSKD